MKNWGSALTMSLRMMNLADDLFPGESNGFFCRRILKLLGACWVQFFLPSHQFPSCIFFEITCDTTIIIHCTFFLLSWLWTWSTTSAGQVWYILVFILKHILCGRDACQHIVSQTSPSGDRLEKPLVCYFFQNIGCNKCWDKERWKTLVCPRFWNPHIWHFLSHLCWSWWNASWLSSGSLCLKRFQWKKKRKDTGFLSSRGRGE